MVRVAVDAMGGDFAPKEIVEGACLALKEAGDELNIILLGDESARACIPEGFREDKRIGFIPTTQTIAMAESPVVAIRDKKDSSIVKGLTMVKNGEAEAYVSAGSTGANLAGAQLIVHTIKGVRKSPLAPLIPTERGQSLLIDCGANVDAKPEFLLQFAILGSIYMENICGIKNPTVGIVNIGAEDEKGNALVKAAFPLLKECDRINFIGSAEARDIPKGVADVYVCDAFVGNVVLKMYEGVSKSLISMIKDVLKSSFITKIGAALIMKPLKKSLKSLSSSEHGGAPLLGLNGLVVKAHGNSTAVEIKNAIMECMEFSKQDITNKFKKAFVNEKE